MDDAASRLCDLQARIASGGDDGTAAQAELIELVQLGMERRARAVQLLNEQLCTRRYCRRWPNSSAIMTKNEKHIKTIQICLFVEGYCCV